LISFSAFGQRKKSKSNDQVYFGYIVIANHNDTIFGEIEFLNPTFNQETVVFYKDDKKTEYRPADGVISEYGFEYRQYNKETRTTEPFWFVYVRKLVKKIDAENGTKEVFLERQVTGEITLYNYFSLETSKINSRTYEHNYFVEKQGVNGFDLISITREDYREKIRDYLVLGNDKIEENLGTSGYGYKYLSSIISVQNAWLTGNPQYEYLLSSVNSKLD
jgi:hypothetical protein